MSHLTSDSFITLRRTFEKILFFTATFYLFFVENVIKHNENNLLK
jgi:hypothetical protein